MGITSVGIIGYGAFGALVHDLIRQFAPGVSVRVSSSRKAPDHETFFSFEDTCACDALVLAVPISAFEETLIRAAAAARPDTVLVDVSTVKEHTTRLLRKLWGERPYVASHPMFGPESLKKRNGDVSGLRIVICEENLPENRFVALCGFLGACGFEVKHMTPEQHDKHLAETLFLTHFIGQIVSQAGFVRTEIDTVSFGYLMDAVESVRQDTQLFKDVFTYDRFCAETLDRFKEYEGLVRGQLEGGAIAGKHEVI